MTFSKARSSVGVIVFLAAAAPLTAQEPQDQLWDASISGDLEVVRTALDAGADVQALDVRYNPNGRKALNWAAWNNHVDIIRELLVRGADINAVNNTGFTPLHHAAENGSIEAAIVLMAEGADRSVRTNAGMSPLEIAERNEHPVMADLLRITAPE